MNLVDLNAFAHLQKRIRRLAEKVCTAHGPGIRKARSTGDLLAYAVHIWSSALEYCGGSRVISLDISQPFDRVWHKGLLAKLPSFVQRINNKVIFYQAGSRSFWSMAKVFSQNCCQSSFPPLKNNSESSSTSPSSKANLFASVFVFNSNLDDQGVQPHHSPPLKFTMSPIKFSTRKVRQTHLQLDTSKSKGPDGIPAIVLKTCAPELAPILNKLFQLSYTLGTFPTSWKQAYVFPFPKNGDKSNPPNYRPIAITSLISKTMETIIT